MKRQTSVNNNNNGCLIIVVGHGSNSDIQDMDSRYNINFRAMPFIGMNNTSSSRFAHSNSRYTKIISMVKPFIDNTQQSVKYELLKRNIEDPEIRHSAWNSIITSFGNNNNFNKLMNAEQKKMFLQKFKTQYYNNYGPSIQTPHNQLFFLPKTNPHIFLENPGLLNPSLHDELGGIFLIRDTIYNNQLSFGNNAYIKEQDNPADFTLVSDLMDRFNMTVDDMRILFSFIFIKNHLFNEPIYAPIYKIEMYDMFNKTDITIDSVIITDFIFNNTDQILNELILKQYKIYKIDLAGLCGLIYLIHALTSRKHALPNKMVDNIAIADTNLFNCIDEIIQKVFMQIKPNEHTGISNYIVNFSSNYNEDSKTEDNSFELNEKFKICLFNCIKESHFKNSVLSYTCRPFTYDDITIDEFFEIINDDTKHIEDRGEMHKLSSKIRTDKLTGKKRGLEILNDIKKDSSATKSNSKRRRVNVNKNVNGKTELYTSSSLGGINNKTRRNKPRRNKTRRNKPRHIIFKK
jgi:hypothetical protein